MLNNILYTFASVDLTPGYLTEETLNTGIITTVVGMGLVFAVLILLALLIWGLTKVVDSSSKN